MRIGCLLRKLGRFLINWYIDLLLRYLGSLSIGLDIKDASLREEAHHCPVGKHRLPMPMMISNLGCLCPHRWLKEESFFPSRWGHGVHFLPLSEMLYKDDLSNPCYTAHSSTFEESRNRMAESPDSRSLVKSYPLPPVKSGRKPKSALRRECSWKGACALGDFPWSLGI